MKSTDWRTELRARLARMKIAPAHEADLVDELAQHLDDQHADLRARGHNDDDARRILLDQLTDESLRDAAESWRRAHPMPPRIPTGIPAGKRRWLETTWQDIRYGWRSLRRSPIFTT